jgi:uncharacterized membrane protein YraQ (UPF0718 family)
MGVFIGMIGNTLTYEPKKLVKEECPHCKVDAAHIHTHKKRTPAERLKSILRYAYIDLPKEIGLELLIGMLLAAFVATFMPIGRLVRMYLGGWFGYVFSVIFGLVMYLCSTASPPLIDSLIKQGMNPGAGMALLLIGPVASYGTILVLRKEFGIKILLIFLGALTLISVILGLGFQLFMI